MGDIDESEVLCVARPSTARLGLDIEMPGRAPCEVSPHWTVTGWHLQFLRLQPDRSAVLNHALGVVHLKVVTGDLIAPELTPFAPPKTVRATQVDAARITAGSTGALVAIFTATSHVPANIHSMDELVFTGPEQQVFSWQTFHDRFGADFFAGVEAYIVPGFHLLDADGAEIVYVHFWTMGKGGNASTHDHSHRPSPHAPAFAEIHWVFNNGTGRGGMYECVERGGPRTNIVMQRGEEHGPLWRFDPDTGLANHRPNGAVEYGLHGWQAGTDDDQTQAFDFVAAFEINPRYAQVQPT